MVVLQIQIVAIFTANFTFGVGKNNVLQSNFHLLSSSFIKLCELFQKEKADNLLKKYLIKVATQKTVTSDL